MSARGDMGRSLRAAKRNNAQDSATAALELLGLSHESARLAAETVIADLAGWLRQRSSPTLNGDPFILAGDWAASLLEEFAP